MGILSDMKNLSPTQTEILALMRSGWSLSSDESKTVLRKEIGVFRRGRNAGKTSYLERKIKTSTLQVLMAGEYIDFDKMDGSPEISLTEKGRAIVLN